MASLSPLAFLLLLWLLGLVQQKLWRSSCDSSQPLVALPKLAEDGEGVSQPSQLPPMSDLYAASVEVLPGYRMIPVGGADVEKGCDSRDAAVDADGVVLARGRPDVQRLLRHVMSQHAAEAEVEVLVGGEWCTMGSCSAAPLHAALPVPSPACPWPPNCSTILHVQPL